MIQKLAPELKPSQTFEIILPNLIHKSKTLLRVKLWTGAERNLKCCPPPLFFWGKGGGATDSPARRRGLGRNPRGLRLSFFKKSAAKKLENVIVYFSITLSVNITKCKIWIIWLISSDQINTARREMGTLGF